MQLNACGATRFRTITTTDATTLVLLRCLGILEMQTQSNPRNRMNSYMETFRQKIIKYLNIFSNSGTKQEIAFTTKTHTHIHFKLIFGTLKPWPSLISLFATLITFAKTTNIHQQ